MSSTSGPQKEHGFQNPIHNPLPSSLASECKQAAKILDSFINPRFIRFDAKIPQRILVQARGLVIFTAFRVGFFGSVRFGSGLIIARLPAGSWSAPSAMVTGGAGVGIPFGLELTDFVFILNSDDAVEKFMHSGSLTVGGNFSVALGPIGRSAEAGAVAGRQGMAAMFAYSKTRGIYGGVTFEGGVLGVRPAANRKMYSQEVSVKQLLTGEITPPAEVEPLMRVLQSDVFYVRSLRDTIPELPSEQPHERRAELASQAPNEPIQGIHELAGDRSLVTELPSGQPHEVPELSTGNPHDAAHELKSSETPPVQSSQQVSG